MKKIKIILGFFYIKSIIFCSIFILDVNAETKIIAKDGDTLFKLSMQYGVSLKELMHKNNFNDANEILEGKIIIMPDKYNEDNKGVNYKVKEGDTLYRIAKDHNLEIKDLVSINNFKDSTILNTNQIILLPSGAVYKKAFARKDIKLARKKVFFHQTTKSEEIGDIAYTHNVSREDIIFLNKLTNQTKVNPNTKLKIRKNTNLKWLKYGSLMINWSEWRYLDGDYITQAKNKKNKSFYIATNCEKRTLNHTLINSSWTSWYFPKSDFEFRLIHDFCDKDLEI